MLVLRLYIRSIRITGCTYMHYCVSFNYHIKVAGYACQIDVSPEGRLGSERALIRDHDMAIILLSEFSFQLCDIR